MFALHRSAIGHLYLNDFQQDENAGISPCYKSMRTNVSREMMELSDYEFDAPTLFPRHEVVYQYLDSYARHFGILGGPEEIIQFNKTVTSVCQIRRVGYLAAASSPYICWRGSSALRYLTARWRFRDW
jgi:cation diffusion facilitator CzcD-associated flavoprotein CzcO